MTCAAAYAAAIGPHARRGSPAKLYRAAGLTPALYASAGRRRDGAISREGSVYLRRALIGLGMGLWQKDPAARAYAAALRERGKPGGIIACALAHRAGKIAFAMHVVLGGWQQGRDPFAGRGDLRFQVAQEGQVGCRISRAITASPVGRAGRAASTRRAATRRLTCTPRRAANSRMPAHLGAQHVRQRQAQAGESPAQLGEQLVLRRRAHLAPAAAVRHPGGQLDLHAARDRVMPARAYSRSGARPLGRRPSRAHWPRLESSLAAGFPPVGAEDAHCP